MSTTTHLKNILDELARNQQWVDDGQLDEFADAILSAHHVFVAGAGRSGVVIHVSSRSDSAGLGPRKRRRRDSGLRRAKAWPSASRSSGPSARTV